MTRPALTPLLAVALLGCNGKIKDQLATTQTDLDQEVVRSDGTEDTVAAQSAQLTDHAAQIAALQGQLAELSAKVDANQAAAESSADALDARVTALEGRADDVDTAIADLESTDLAHADQLSLDDARMDGIDQGLYALGSSLQTEIGRRNMLESSFTAYADANNAYVQQNDATMLAMMDAIAFGTEGLVTVDANGAVLGPIRKFSVGAFTFWSPELLTHVQVWWFDATEPNRQYYNDNEDRLWFGTSNCTGQAYLVNQHGYTPEISVFDQNNGHVYSPTTHGPVTVTSSKGLWPGATCTPSTAAAVSGISVQDLGVLSSALPLGTQVHTVTF